MCSVLRLVCIPLGSVVFFRTYMESGQLKYAEALITPMMHYTSVKRGWEINDLLGEYPY